MEDNKQFKSNNKTNFNNILMTKSIKLDIPGEQSKNVKSFDIKDNYESEKRKGCGNARWSKLMYDYALETSFHGPKQFVEPQPFILRRLIWFAIFLAGTAIFVMQTVTSIQRHYSYPVSVNVKVNYNTSIVFPAVTVCNGNAFRESCAVGVGVVVRNRHFHTSEKVLLPDRVRLLSKSYENGYYDLITDVYSNPDNTDMSKYDQTPRLDELYTLTGHAFSDLIVSCFWNNGPCQDEDFTVTMTDLGKCYTFNSEANIHRRKAYQTGSNGGVKLQLNTEQYEYMAGPNKGAGLKVLIHNPLDIPLVKDHGLGIPPGSHGMIGIKTSVIHNLPPNYGICNDSVKLNYFDDYTIENCYTNCKEKYFQERCGCRDIYMPAIQGLPKVCNINLYNTCMRQAQAEFIEKVKEKCQRDCPIPCDSIFYQPSVSYASISNFDIDTLLRGNSTENLKKRFVKAREITQRVNQAIVNEDKQMITNLDRVVNKLDTAFKQMDENLQISAAALKDYYDRFAQRIEFHTRRGLGGVKYVLEYNYMRAWDVYKERAFHYVTLDFMDFPKFLKSTIEAANGTESQMNAFTRQQLMASLFARYKGKKDLMQRSRDYVNETNMAFYSNSTPLLTYKFSYDRRYDLTYITHYVLNERAPYWNWEKTFLTIMTLIDTMDNAVDAFVEVGNQYVETGIFNESFFSHGEHDFIKAMKSYNYRMFMYEQYIVKRPLTFHQKTIDEFARLNTIFLDAYTNVEWKISQIQALFNTSKKEWQVVHEINAMASEYLNNPKVLKTPLALEVMKKGFVEAIQLIDYNFNQIRAKVAQLLDAIVIFQSSIKDIWKAMMHDKSTEKFYRHMYDDCQVFLSTNDTELFLEIFSQMLWKKPIPEMVAMRREDVVALVNGDIHGINIEKFLVDFDKQFSELRAGSDLISVLDSNDLLFVKYVDDLQTSLTDFVNGNKVGSSFFKENFMTLDVFMKELSYEEISQQEDYDITQMLSDIGGSMGLFIGGSVLSAFEFVDVFLHQAAKIVLHK